MRIDSSGNVGIGTSATVTNANLNVSSGINTQSGLVGYNINDSFTLNGGTNPHYGISFSPTNLRPIGISGYYGIAFASSGTERMRIDDSGKVGIGTSSPSSQDASANNLVISDTAGNGGLTINTPTNAIGAIHFSDGTSGADRYRGIISYGHSDNTLRFHTDTTRRMTINSSGNLLVGMTSENFSTSDSGCLLRNTGDVYFPIQSSNTLHVYDAPNQAYRFYVNVAGIISATNTSINGLSDERLKENIVDLETGLTEVMALQPRRFDWKNGDAQNVAGFIAQEVESVLPELVGDYKHEELDDCKSLKMGDIVPTLVKAIQEQQAQIEALQSEINLLKGE